LHFKTFLKRKRVIQISKIKLRKVKLNMPRIYYKFKETMFTLKKETQTRGKRR